MRRKWIVATALAALLLTGAITGTALAQTDSSDERSVSRFVELLAGKLGIGEEELQTAVDETHEELQAERKAAWEQQLRDKLDGMVEEGRITQEQADEYMEWYLNPPSITKEEWGGKHHFRGGHHKRGFKGGLQDGSWGYRPKMHLEAPDETSSALGTVSGTAS